MPEILYDYHIFVEHGKISKFYQDGLKPMNNSRIVLSNDQIFYDIIYT